MCRGQPSWNSKVEKTTYVYNLLKRTAAQTQAPILAQLQAQGVSYQSFYIYNMIAVTAGRSMVEWLASRPEVARIVPSYRCPHRAGGPGSKMAHSSRCSRIMARLTAPNPLNGILRASTPTMCGIWATTVKAWWWPPTTPVSIIPTRPGEPLSRQPGRRQLRPQLQLVGWNRRIPVPPRL